MKINQKNPPKKALGVKSRVVTLILIELLLVTLILSSCKKEEIEMGTIKTIVVNSSVTINVGDVTKSSNLLIPLSKELSRCKFIGGYYNCASENVIPSVNKSSCRIYPNSPNSQIVGDLIGTYLGNQIPITESYCQLKEGLLFQEKSDIYVVFQLELVSPCTSDDTVGFCAVLEFEFI